MEPAGRKRFLATPVFAVVYHEISDDAAASLFQVRSVGPHTVATLSLLPDGINLGSEQLLLFVGDLSIQVDSLQCDGRLQSLLKVLSSVPRHGIFSKGIFWRCRWSVCLENQEIISRNELKMRVRVIIYSIYRCSTLPVHDVILENSIIYSIYRLSVSHLDSQAIVDLGVRMPLLGCPDILFAGRTRQLRSRQPG